MGAVVQLDDHQGLHCPCRAMSDTSVQERHTQHRARTGQSQLAILGPLGAGQLPATKVRCQ
eukprot:COSAG02_NODE_68665_length_231_cov_1.818182_1_plen_60_part_01